MSKDRRTARDNPWLIIPAEDYEAHMEQVGQLTALNHIFADILSEFLPKNLIVVGCATGNGFEHIDPSTTHQTIGIDINQGYLDILKKRFAGAKGLELICADLASQGLNLKHFDLVFAALVFEYINPEKFLPEIHRWLKPGGLLVTILQMSSSASEMISDTPYDTLKSLSSTMNLVDPDDFHRQAEKFAFSLVYTNIVELPRQKRFLVGIYCSQ
jgi:SAM-dependent methyltransferase